jgi:cytosine/adenosine deaminase-related metal-dependent hydrolase
MPAVSHAPAAFQARWVVPVDQTPLDRGIVTVAGGKIVAVGENKSGRPPRDLGDVALLPGLVNAHTHLEFSVLEQPLGRPEMPFAEWIGELVAYRRQRDKALMVETDGFARFARRWAEAGLKELRSAAVVAAGDIATRDWTSECSLASGIYLAVFYELRGLDPAAQATQLDRARSFIDELYEVGRSARPGLSPHAPYTVGPEFLRNACELSAATRTPVAMHVAESTAELELLASHSGELVELLQSLGAWRPDAIPRGIRPLDYLELLATAHRSLVIHGNFLAASEINLIAAHRERMSLVYCPRTHSYFQHGRYPLAQMLAAGARVAVGTDSRASNPDLRLLEEVRHAARQHPDVPPHEVLKLGTLYGAESLGLARRLGSITPGKDARLAVVPIDPASLLG